jgi:hypothetical protein
LYQGKSYDRCTLLIDEQTRRAEVQRPGGLGRRKQQTLVSFEYGQASNATVSDRTVQIQEIKLVAQDSDTATEIGQILSFAAQVLVRNEASRSLRESVAELLKQRASIVDFLSRYRSAPRQALFGLSVSFESEDADPAKTYLEGAKAELTKSLERVSAALVEYEKSFGGPAADKVFAFVYAAGKLQDAVVDGAVGEAAKQLLNELGIGDVAGTGAIDLTESVLRRANSLLFAA